MDKKPKNAWSLAKLWEEAVRTVKGYPSAIWQALKGSLFMMKKEKREEVKRQIWIRWLKLFFKSNPPWLWLAASVAAALWGNRIIMSLVIDMSAVYGGTFTPAIVVNVMLLTLLQTFLRAFFNYANYAIGAKVTQNAATSMWKKYMNLPVGYFDKYGPRELLSRVSGDVSVTGIITRTRSDVAAVWESFRRVLELVLCFDIIQLAVRNIWNLDVTLMVIVIAVSVAKLGVTVFTSRIQMHVLNFRREKTAKLTQFLSERVANIPLIKSFVAEKKTDEAGREQIKDNFFAKMRENVAYNVINVFAGAVQTILVAIMYYRGYMLIQSGAMDVPGFIQFILYSVPMLSALSDVCYGWSWLKQAQGSLNRVSQVMAFPSEDFAGGSDVTDGTLKNDLVFENVTFAYGEENVLTNVSFEVPYGKTTAIVGPSGSGKSTIVKLVERLYDPSAGDVKVGGSSIKGYNLKKWREGFGYVTQDTSVVSGTIRENILYGVNREIGDAELKKACEIADIDSFVKDQPDGMNTDVGEFGNRLSGGQKQRIAIARAILRNPNYLLLDEPTSSLDPASENAVQRGLEKLMEGRTSIVIAHNIAAVMNADQIIVLDEGRIAGSGRHEELLATCGKYKQYFELQQTPAMKGDVVYE